MTTANTAMIVQMAIILYLDTVKKSQTTKEINAAVRKALRRYPGISTSRVAVEDALAQLTRDNVTAWSEDEKGTSSWTLIDASKRG